MTEIEISSAFVWAARVNPAAVPLFSLAKGEQFRWPNGGGPVLTYSSRGWYSMPNVPIKLRAGVKTAVMLVKEVQVDKSAEPLRFQSARYCVMRLGGRNPKLALSLTGELTSGIYVMPIYIEYSYDEQYLMLQAARFNAQLVAVGKLHPPPYRGPFP